MVDDATLLHEPEGDRARATSVSTLDDVQAPERSSELASRARRAATSPITATVVAGAIFAYRAWTPTLWLDEGITAEIARRSVHEIRLFTHFQERLLEPYYLFLHIWTRLFGNSEMALRLPSVIGCAVAVGAVAALGRRWFNAQVGIVAAALLAVVPAMSRYGQEARPYGLVIGGAACTILALDRALDRRSWQRWVTYSALLCATCLLHVVAIGIVLVCIARLLPRPPRAAIVATLIALIPAAILLFSARGQQSGTAWIPHPTPADLRSFPTQFFGEASVGAILLALAVAAIGRRRRQDVVLGAWAIGLIAIAFLVSQSSQSIWLSRYLLFCLPAWALLASQTVRRRVPAALAIALIIAFGYPAQHAMRTPSGHGDDLRAAAAFLVSQEAPGDAVVFDPAWAQTIRYYTVPTAINDVLRVPGFPAEAPGGYIYPPQRSSDAGRILPAVGRIWLVTWAPGDPQLESAIAASHHATSQTAGFGTTSVTLWVAGAAGSAGTS